MPWASGHTNTSSKDSEDGLMEKTAELLAKVFSSSYDKDDPGITALSEAVKPS